MARVEKLKNLMFVRAARHDVPERAEVLPAQDHGAKQVLYS